LKPSAIPNNPSPRLYFTAWISEFFVLRDLRDNALKVVHYAQTSHAQDKVAMNQTIQNGISSLENLFAVNAFRIPQYQRAY
jgi:hypothetical protein